MIGVAALAAALTLAVPSHFQLVGYHASPLMKAWVAESKMPLPPERVWVNWGDPMTPWGSHEIDLPGCCTEGWTHLAIRGLLFHELGHLYDRTEMTPGLRAQFRALVGVPAGWNWWAPYPVEGPVVTGDGGYTLVPGWIRVKVPPGEMFAEEYAACSLGLTQWQYQQAGYNSYGWLPQPGMDAALCDLMRSAASGTLTTLS